MVLDCICYTFEQAAFTSTGPEALYEILLNAGFEDSHAKVSDVTASDTRSLNHFALLNR
jgi:hypothetical protein